MIYVLNQNVKVKNKLLFPPHQFQLEGSGFENTMKKVQKGSQNLWDSFDRPGPKFATPMMSSAFAAKTKNPQAAQATTNILETFSGDKILSLTDRHGIGLRLKVMYFISWDFFLING